MGKEKGAIMSEAKDDSLCSMYFAVSCAFFALKCLSQKAQLDDHKCMETKYMMLQGKINELKRIRSEDAKANEKVAGIYSAQEQTWFAERRRLHRQIGDLMRILDEQKTDAISAKIYASEEENKRKEMEEKVKCLETVLEELRERTKLEALRQKTAFINLVSNYRQLEAELGRTRKQAEASKQQLDSVFQEKEAALLLIEQLSLKMVKIHTESQQKDKILSDKATRLDEWVHLELNTFAEEIQVKDDKLEAYRRKLRSTEIECKRLQSQIESLNESMSQLRCKDSKVEVKADVHALGVSYKIKQLRQQLLMLDRLAGNQEHGLIRRKGSLLMLNRQMSRYKSIQKKIDDLSQRMGDEGLYVKQGVSGSSRRKEETKTMEQFRVETFQLQRFMVATGQKLIEINSKLASSVFVEVSKERFCDTIQCLFKDVQRGLELRIARITGELGGSLACDNSCLM